MSYRLNESQHGKILHRRDASMGKVFSHATMSLDGYVADPNHQVGSLFDWYNAGDDTVLSADTRARFNVDGASAEYLQGIISATGALIAGRRLFDFTNGWDDNHPVGAPVVVVTHRPPEHPENWPRTTFVNGVESAVARARDIAGDKDVNIASASIVHQALDLGLVDEVHVSLAPVLFGKGIPYFATNQHHLLGDPTAVIQGRRATHLAYPVRRQLDTP
jgi:dihydrofolate reductase